MFQSDIAAVPARDAMLVRFDTLSPHMTIGESLEVLRHTQQDDFPVVAEGRLEGMVSKNDVLTALAEMPREARIGEIMHRDFVQSDPATPLGVLLRLMEQHDKDAIPIVEGGRVVGLLSYDQVGRYHSLVSTGRGDSA